MPECQAGVTTPRRALELEVHGIGTVDLGLADLTRRGAVLLVFVSEECPTSAMALRRLGPLCRSWEEKGLSTVAIFEDPLEVGARVARRFGWTGTVAAEDPPYETSRAYNLDSVPTSVLIGRDKALVEVVVGWDQPALVRLLGRAEEMVGSKLDVPSETEPLAKPGCSSKAALDPRLAAAVAAGGTDEIEEMFARGWTDGLPVVPPTRARVDAMLAGRDGSLVLGAVPPSGAVATLERVAACAVLAGCLPSYFPVVMAAARAALDPRFNLHGQAVTTQPAGQLIVVNGPIREAIGLNSGMGALGPGWRANMTIGRALRLLVSLTGGGMPGKLDRSTLGHSGKIGFCLAEDEETSPFEPLHVERGFDAGKSVVTLIGADAPLSVSDHRSRTPEDLAWVLGWAAASTWSTNWWPLEEPSVFVICPEHAAMFREARWSKDRLRNYIFDAVHKPARELRRGETTPSVHAAGDLAEIPKWRTPESIVIVVAGGEAGRYSAVLGPCTGMGFEIISKEVD